MTYTPKRAEADAERIFDAAILRHGFTAYMRDYDVLFDVISAGAPPERWRYRFTHCPQVEVTSTIRDWAGAWPDELTDHATVGELAGFVWGVMYSTAYPGMSYVADSPSAAKWSRRVGHPMHEATIETEVFRLTVVFHDLLGERLAAPDGEAGFAAVPLA